MGKQKNWYLILWFDRCVLRRSTKRTLKYFLDEKATLKKIKSGWFEVKNNRNEVTIGREDVIDEIMNQNGADWDKFKFI